MADPLPRPPVTLRHRQPPGADEELRGASSPRYTAQLSRQSFGAAAGWHLIQLCEKSMRQGSICQGQLPLNEGAVEFNGFRTKMPTSVQAVEQGALLLTGSKESRSPKVHINSGISFIFPFLLGWFFVLFLVL